VIPVRVYWLRYNTPGERKPLSFIERRLAFGILATPRDGEAGSFDIRFVSYRKRSARLSLDERGNPMAVTAIRGRPAKLQWVFLMLGDYELIPEVAFIELFGSDLATGEPVYERFVP